MPHTLKLRIAFSVSVVAFGATAAAGLTTTYLTYAAISDSPVERYLAQRGLQRASDQVRYLKRTPFGPRGAVQFLPAMLAAVTTDIGVIAVHRTFLEVASGKLAGFERPKRALGSLGCGAVRVAPPEQGRLGLAEGIESALSAMQLFGIPCWATPFPGTRQQRTPCWGG